MFITAAAAIASLAGAAYGAIKSGQANRQADKIRKGIRDDNKRWYDIEMARDYTQRADVQAAIKKQRELLQEQYRNARSTNIVAGGTDEARALQQQAANKSLSDTTTNIAARATDYKDSVDRQYRQTDQALAQQAAQSKNQHAAEMAQASSQMVNSGIQLAGNAEYLGKVNGADSSASQAAAGGADAADAATIGGGYKFAPLDPANPDAGKPKTYNA